MGWSSEASLLLVERVALDASLTPWQILDRAEGRKRCSFKPGFKELTILTKSHGQVLSDFHADCSDESLMLAVLLA